MSWLDLIDLKQIVNFATTTIIQEAVAGGRTEDEAEATAGPEGSPRPKGGCPHCSIHRHVSDAWGFLQSNLTAADDHDGQIPRRIRTTLYLARQDLEQASSEAQQLRARMPSLDAECRDVIASSDLARLGLPDPQTCTADDCARAMPALLTAHAATTRLSDRYEELAARAHAYSEQEQIARRHGVDDPDAFFRELYGDHHG